MEEEKKQSGKWGTDKNLIKRLFFQPVLSDSFAIAKYDRIGLQDFIILSKYETNRLI